MASTAPSPTVLIVEDDEGLARLLEKAVRREGFVAASAPTGAAAIAWLRDHPVQLMLLDMKLPDMDGADLLQCLKECGRLVPFIIMTGRGGEEIAVEMMKRGALDYLVKNVEFLELVPTVVRRAVAQIDQQKKLQAAEEALDREHAFSNTVLETSGAMMIVLDLEGRFIRVNRQFEKTSGYSLDEIREKRFWEVLMPPAEQDLWREKFGDNASDPSPREHDGPLITKGGEYRDIAWSITGLPDQQGKRKFIIVSGIDTTDRKRLEREILAISDREQRRVGQDLHDGLCQVLAGVDALIRVLEKRLSQTSAGDAQAAAMISSYMKQAMEQARMVARGLSPVEVETNGLMAALRELAEHTRSLFKIACVFECDKPVLVEDHTQATHVYRIAQEAINNAIKHGKAKQISIVLQAHDDLTASLVVKDDGTGFSEGAERPGGMGLRTMNYRAGLIGARLEIAPRQPKGIAVECTFPLKGRPAVGKMPGPLGNAPGAGDN